MLKKDILIADPVLATLTEEQIAAVEKLSANEEQTVIDTNRSEWWNGIDRDIKEVFGVDKLAGNKTYKHLKSVLSEANEKAKNADSLSAKLSEKENTIATLNEQLKKGGGDEALKTRIEKLESEKLALSNEVSSVKASYQSQVEEFEKLEKARQTDKLDSTLNSKFLGVEKDFKFLPNLPQGVLDREIEAAKRRVRAKGTPVLQDDGTFAFLDEKNVPLKNPKKGLENYTPEDLFLEEMQASGILDKKRMIAGAGGGTKKAGGEQKTFVDLSEATTQVQAFTAIEKQVLANGIAKTAPFGQFNKEVTKIAKENGVFELPVE